MNTLPPHTIRESSRTRRVHLRVSLDAGVEVVVPPGFDRARIPALLREKQRWLDRALREIEQQRTLASLDPPEEFPKCIDLRAIGETWTVEATATSNGRAAAREADGFRLLVAGSSEGPSAWRPTLKRWLMRKATRHLIPWLESVAAERGLAAPRVSIRCPRSRWGSYSRRGTLSLNAQLLFLPPELVRYVFLHELCHTVHLDHSERFWRLLAQHSPGALELRQGLRGGWRLVPGWLRDDGSPTKRGVSKR